MNYFLLLCAVSLYFSLVACQTENECAEGTNCLPIAKCKTYLPLARKPKKTPEDIAAMRKAFCGFQDGTPKVCCPDAPCRAGGVPGTCVAVRSCPHVARLLAAPTPAENILRVQALRCNGPGRYSVCCADDPEPDTVTTSAKPATVPSVKPVTVPGPRPTVTGYEDRDRLAAVAGACSTAAPPEPASGCCGRDVSSDDRISNGNDTAVDQYPWLALIEYRSLADGSTKLMCGGSLISAKYVLTAGHCIAGLITTLAEATNIRLGEYDTSHDGPDCLETAGDGRDCTTPVVIAIERTIPHPQYQPYSPLRKHDIGLLRLATMAPYTDFIRPICLPATDVTAAPPDALSFWAAGWGAVDARRSSSSVKQHVEVPYNTLEKCQTYYVGRMRYQLLKEQICAGGKDHKDSCQGDSGGPLMYINDVMDYFEAVGVVSFGPSPCGEHNMPGVYTKVYEYNAWIKSEMVP